MMAYFGHTAPLSTHALVRSPNAACVPGAGSRSGPGFQPQPTSSSLPLCSISCARRHPAVLLRILDRPRRSGRASAPATPSIWARGAIWGCPAPCPLHWRTWRCAGRGRSRIPFPPRRTRRGRASPADCASAIASPCVGLSVRGWQLRQRGLVSTLPISVKIAADRAFLSAIAGKRAGGFETLARRRRARSRAGARPTKRPA